jgi:hypothetical protein
MKEERVTKYSRQYEHQREEGKNEGEEEGGMNIMSSNRKKRNVSFVEEEEKNRTVASFNFYLLVLYL